MATTRYFYYPWAGGVGGTKDSTPTQDPGDGTASYQTGYGTRYSTPPDDPESLPVPRLGYNGVLYDITQWIQQLTQYGTPNFITSADNLGVAYSYDLYARVLYSYDESGDPGTFRNYTSITTSNNTVPTTQGNWVWVKGTEQDLSYQNPAGFGPSVTQGNPVYFDGSIFRNAIANGAQQQNVIGIADVTNNIIITQGQFIYDSDVLTPGSVYYLSNSVGGALTTTPLAPNIFQIGVAITERILLLTLQNISAGIYTGIPVGQIAFFAMSTAPNGWLYANGDLKATADYPALFDAIGYTYGGSGANFNLPDARDRVLRGYGGANTGVFGEGQADTFASHTHTAASNLFGVLLVPSVSGIPSGNAPQQPAIQTITIGNTGDDETRGKSLVILPCIKY